MRTRPGPTATTSRSRGEWGWREFYVCSDPVAHGHHDLVARPQAEIRKRIDEMTEDERETARAERRDVIESNKAWGSAETVRRNWLRTFLTRKTAPKGTGTFLAVALAEDTHLLSDHGANHRAANLLGLGDGPQFGRQAGLRDAARTATEGRAQVIALAQVLAAYEASADREAWRTPRPAIARYLTFLADHGYTLSPVEGRAQRAS